MGAAGDRMSYTVSAVAWGREGQQMRRQDQEGAHYLPTIPASPTATLYCAASEVLPSSQPPRQVAFR